MSEYIRSQAKAILAGKPPRSYVESALEFARFILDHPIHLPGWECPSCHGFNGEEKEILSTCRACGAARPTVQETGARLPVGHVG